ncbi:MAG: 30S ribosome-binding factor RbfA [Burkholderiaceae bacterium]
MKRQQAPSGRAQRVAEQLHHEVAEMIRGEVKDPRIGLVTVTGVDLTPDYAVLTVHFSVIPDDEASVSRSLAGLRAAAGFLRSRIGRRVRIHTTPEIRFAHDASTAHGMAMSRLIEQAVSQRAADDETPVVPPDDEPDDDTRAASGQRSEPR